MANILYLGNNHPSATSCHRANALRRLGHQVAAHDVDEMLWELPLASVFEPLHYRTGYYFVQPQVTKWVKKLLAETLKPDLIWVNSGDKLGPDSLKLLKEVGCPIILYNNDDPTGGRDGSRFNSMLRSLEYYDLCVVMRDVNVREFEEYGAKKVMRVWMSYDEVVHRPYPEISAIPPEYLSDIVFIGTWMRNEKRDEFLLELINNGLPMAIYGDRWKKSPFWEQLKAYYRGGSLSGRDYVAAIQGAKICLGLLSKGNRDLHTQRSLEVPYAGGLLCAERTSEHQELYLEGVEATFWDDAAECAKACRRLLDDDQLRKAMRLNGMQRIRNNEIGNEDICRKILKEVNLLTNTQVKYA